MNLDLNKLTCTASLTDTERAVLEFLLTHIDEALKLGVRGVAKANFTSTSTVMRLSRKLGYNGFIEMYYKLLGAAGKGTPVYELNEGFLSHFAGDGNVSMENYRSLRLAAQRIHKTDQMVFIYGMGFSSMMAEYLAKKLLVLGIKDIVVFIAFSRSGRSPYVLNRVKMAEENSVFTMGFTNDGASPLKEYCSCVIEVPDDNPLDDRNMKPTLFFSKTITMIELLIYEYYQISIG